MSEDKWVVKVEETLVRSKTFELSVDDFVALTNISNC